MSECKHEHCYWYLSKCTEDGWQCVDCGVNPGEPPGFSPEFDRAATYEKVASILYELVEHDFIHVSNGSEGDGLTAAVVAECHRLGFYDQWSIVRMLVGHALGSHSKYWKDVSEGVIAGKDPRHRCPCGALATSTTFNRGETVYRCSRCAQDIWRRGPRTNAEGLVEGSAGMVYSSKDSFPGLAPSLRDENVNERGVRFTLFEAPHVVESVSAGPSIEAVIQAERADPTGKLTEALLQGRRTFEMVDCPTCGRYHEKGRDPNLCRGDR